VRNFKGHSVNAKGFSTIELMIASTLGLLLLSGVVSLFIGSNRNYSMQEQLSTIQENGRFAVMYLEDQLQKAGWGDDYLADAPAALDLTLSSDGATDAIAISFLGKAGAVIDDRDCNGEIVAGGTVINRFYVDGTTNQMMCQGNGGAGIPQPFLSNVEKFEVLYGVDTDTNCPDGVVNTYMNRDAILAQGYKGYVYSIKFALLLKGDRPLQNIVQKSGGYQILDKLYIPQEDKIVRRLFQQTVFMPNAVFATSSSPDRIMQCMMNNL